MTNQAEKPPIWDNTTVCFGGDDCPNCEREKRNADAKPAEPSKHGRDCLGPKSVYGCTCKSEPTPPPPVEPGGCGCHGPCGRADCCKRCAEPGSEPPIDFDAQYKTAQIWAECGLFEAYGPGRRALGRAYLALKAERDNFKAEIATLRSERVALAAKASDLQARNDAQAEDMCNWFRTHEENAMCQDRHRQIWYVSRTTENDCPMCALAAQVKELEDVIVNEWESTPADKRRYFLTYRLEKEVERIRARKESEARREV